MARTHQADELTVATVTAWRAWLHDHHAESPGVWLVLAKKGKSSSTTLTYDDALGEALCHGWIDGQKRQRDEATFEQRFTPRRSRSQWSKRNVAIAEGLIKAGRMHAAGLLEVERAKGDGRWAAAYDGQAAIAVPDDLAAALQGAPEAAAMFEALNSRNRYAVLYRITTARRADTRARRIEQFVAMLARGETIHPQREAR
jgi:uncharacterized protein YdeI (YjbR/CyaY-like superfamily)